MTWIAILSAGLLPPTFDMVRVTSVTPMTMNMPYHSASLPIPIKLADESLQHTSSDLSHDDGGKVHLTISVDVSGILPEGLWDPRTGTMVVNLEKIYILTINFCPTSKPEGWLCEEGQTGSLLGLLSYWDFETKFQVVASDFPVQHSWFSIWKIFCGELRHDMARSPQYPSDSTWL